MPSLIDLVASLTEGIKINAVTCEARDGRAMWRKRRRWTAWPVVAGANVFFRLAEAPLRTQPNRALWQEWEVASFRLLHGGEGLLAFAEGRDGVLAEKLPGTNLTCFLDGGTLTPAMTASAARELRRAHKQWSPALGAQWSHGDPHAGNFIYEEAAERARLIDFEVMHDPALAEEERHADDVLVFLQDMAGRIAAERWRACAEAFLLAYGRPEILALVREKLTVPRFGFPRLWWAVRTTFLPMREMKLRFGEVRALPVFGALEPALELPALASAGEPE